LRIVLGLGDPVLYATEEGVGLVMQSNQDVFRQGNWIHINNEGFREEKNMGIKKPDIEYRVFFLGDSVTYAGSYIKDNETFTSLVEAKLNNIGGFNDFNHLEVVNTGVNSYSVQNMLSIYEKKVLKYDPDAIVLFIPNLDMQRSFRTSSNIFWNRKPALATHDLLHHFISTFGLIANKHISRLFDSELVKKEKEDIIKTEIENNAEAIRKMVEISKENSIIFFVVMSPYESEVYEDAKSHPVQEVIVNVSNELGVNMYSIRDCLKKRKDQLLFYDSVHYSREGHFAVADCLLSVLIEEIGNE